MDGNPDPPFPANSEVSLSAHQSMILNSRQICWWAQESTSVPFNNDRWPEINRSIRFYPVHVVVVRTAVHKQGRLSMLTAPNQAQLPTKMGNPRLFDRGTRPSGLETWNIYFPIMVHIDYSVPLYILHEPSPAKNGLNWKTKIPFDPLTRLTRLLLAWVNENIKSGRS